MRNYLMVGIVGLVLMVPLAATSTNAMIKRLGGRWWKRLHRLIYIVAIAGVLHFVMLVKADLNQPITYGTPIVGLLVWRVGSHYWRLRADALHYRNSSESLPSPLRGSDGKTETVRPKPWSGQLRVAKIFDETPDVRTFRLVSMAEPRLPFDFLPGQHLNLSVVIDGKKVYRSYTIASTPTRVASCEVTVKREPMGLCSRYLHDHVRVGTLIDVRAPAGSFTFTGAEADSLVLIAAGVGITPLMSKIRYLTDIGWPGDIYLVYVAKTESDIIFREEIDYLRTRFSNLHVALTLTRSSESTGPWNHGRITPELLQAQVQDIGMRRVHICGPSTMIEATRQMLVELGVPEASIHSELFHSVPSNWDEGSLTRDESASAFLPPAAASASVTFAHSGKSTPMSAHKTILEAAEDLGVNINYDCRSGVCGTCKTGLLAGRVRMDAEDALDARDRAKNVILSCQARCLDEVVVDA